MSNANDFIIENGVLTQYVGPGGDVVIPEGVTLISKLAFPYDAKKKTTSLTIPEGVVSIQDSTFERFFELETVILPNSLKVIAYNAFGHCRKLKNITIPMGVSKIGQYAFQFCKEIRTITIPNPECAIDEYAFYESGLEELTAPWKKSFGLNGCAKLRTVKITTIMGDRWTLVNSWGEECTQGPATFKLSPKSEMLDKIYAPQCDISRLGNAKTEAVLGYVELVDNNYPVEEQFDSAYENYIRKQKKKLYPIAIQDMHLLNYMMRKKIIPLADIAVCMELAEKQSEPAVTAALLEYQHTSFNAKDHTKHEEQQISKVLHVPTQTENLKKDFSTKKDEDGTLIVTVYKGDSKDIVIPEQIGKGKVATIGPEAFSPQNVRITPEQRAVRRNIQSVTIGKHITMIGYSAFEGCENLAQVYIENENVEIGNRA